MFLVIVREQADCLDGFYRITSTLSASVSYYFVHSFAHSFLIKANEDM